MSQDLGFRLWDSGFEVQGLGRVQDSQKGLG